MAKTMNNLDLAVDSKPDISSVKQHQKRKRVAFVKELVMEIKEADVYDREAVPSDIFSCDVCNARIPCGIRGFEPYATCEMCEDGFDVCAVCCGAKALMRRCDSTKFLQNEQKPSIKSKCHKHKLTIVNREAEVLWANDNGLLSQDSTRSNEHQDFYTTNELLGPCRKKMRT